MHDTAFRIGKLAMNIYADLSTASVLEVGSQAINGSLRENALPTTNYVGLDIEDGEGVDIVAEPGELPVDDESFDLVIASSVFEHDSAFWMTFLEMCRKTKDGGYIYVNAPSNGCVHRFPQDNWRFYPDSGVALVKWAVSQGQNVSLVESFIAERTDDIWNDFVAVFRKGRITKKLPETFLYENVPSTNIITWKSKEVINPRDVSQDMVLLDQARGQLKAVEQASAEAIGERDNATRESNEFRAKCEALQNDLTTATQSLQDFSRVRDELAHRESELRQRHEEIEQTRAELAQARMERDDTAAERDELTARVAELNLREAELEKAQAELIQLRGERDKLVARVASAEQSIELLGKKLENSQSAVAELEREAVRTSHALKDASRWKDMHDRQVALAMEMRDSFERMRGDQERLYADRRARDEAANKQALRTAMDQVAAAEASTLEQQNATHLVQSQMHVRFQEIATLTSLLRQQEQLSDTTSGHLDWLRAVHESLASQPGWWSLMPRKWRREREKRRLQRHGLFDGSAYLERYPDVAAAGLDPLYHYMAHGLYEGRSK